MKGSARTKVCIILVVVATVVTTALGSVAAFDIDAKAALLMDANTGQVLFEKNADEPHPPASLAKIMTLLVVMDAVEAGKVKLTDEVRTSRHASQMGGSQVYLAEGEVHTLEEMLKAVAVASGNDASVAVAEFLAGTDAAFTQLMNKRAQELGMTQSVFRNPDGLPPSKGEDPSLITARDIAKAARTLILEHPKVLEWTSIAMEKFRDKPLFILYNTNGLVGTYDGLDGLKTGSTSAAGWNLVATAKRGDLRLISVVLGTESHNAREERTRSLLDHGFNRFVPVVVGEGKVGEIHVPSGTPEQVDVKVEEPVRVLKPRGEEVVIETEVREKPQIEAPLAKGEQVGTYVVRMGGKEVLSRPVTVANDVERAGFFVRMWRAARDFVLGLFSG